MKVDPILFLASAGLILAGGAPGARPVTRPTPPAAGWTPGPTLALSATRLIRLQMGENRVLWQGAAGPGELRLYTLEAPPLPTPPGPTPPGPKPEPGPAQGPSISFGPFLGQEGAERTVFVVGEPIRIRGHGFGDRPGKLFIRGYPVPVSRWTDTELVTRYDEANRVMPVWLAVRTADGRGHASGRGKGMFFVVARDQIPSRGR